MSFLVLRIPPLLGDHLQLDPCSIIWNHPGKHISVFGTGFASLSALSWRADILFFFPFLLLCSRAPVAIHCHVVFPMQHWWSSPLLSISGIYPSLSSFSAFWDPRALCAHSKRSLGPVPSLSLKEVLHERNHWGAFRSFLCTVDRMFLQ